MTTELDPNDPSTLATLLNQNRLKVLAGEEVSPEDYSLLIEALRAGRLRSASTSPKPKGGSKPSGPVIVLDPDNLEPLF